MRPIDRPPRFIGETSAIGTDDLAYGRLCVGRGGEAFDLLIQNTDRPVAPRLFVLLSGARDPQTHPLPKFDRWKWTDKFPGVMVNISDPGLREKDGSIRIGWYIGDRKRNFVRLATEIVSEAAGLLGIETRNVFYYGSSAGGFASLCMASDMVGSTAVCINPQIQVLNYETPHVVKSFLKFVYKEAASDLNAEDLLRMDAAVQFRMATSSRCLYVQNTLDKSHYEVHYRYFRDVNRRHIARFPFSKQRVQVMTYSSTSGHGPEPTSMIDEIIARAIKLARTAY